ncbi:DUF1330 domain-containing protein [Pseudahrensia aquimaris]|uniref:DUF1330 domain-containing protein n=1 Tax=Pseudahrensia aquimaris TaxID=744461 RepID=A0ABW3FIL5_9HYPH
MADAFIDPDRGVFKALRELPLDHPVEMLNLVRLRQRAAYADGRDATGAEAYAAYGRESGPIFRKVGGEIIWSATPELMLIGPQEERWDVAFVARYPTGQAFLDMVYDPAYQAIVFHRQAAVETSRLLRTKPKDAASEGFG